MDGTTRSSYQAALKQAEAELASHEKRGEALKQTVMALRNLLALGVEAPAAAPPAPKPVRKRKPRRKIIRGNHPPIPAGHFGGMGPTAAYRKFVAEFGMDHPVPSIRDALLAGGVRTKSSTSLLTGLHSVRRRDEMKAKAAESAKAAEAGAEDGGE
ncbi:MAG: hypothetical protein OXK77_07340 [Gemmatimonadota bacterium]|nr:hypothetical protein [Gemmatimonadota bacterium]